MEELLSSNLIGNITFSDNNIYINNPYSTKAIIIEVIDDFSFADYEDIINTQKFTDNIYIVDFSSATDTKNAYNYLNDDNNTISIILDKKVHIVTTSSIQSINSKNIALGAEYTALDLYSSKLNYKNSYNEIKIAVLDTGINSSHEVFSISDNKIDNTYSNDYVNNDVDVRDGNETQDIYVILAGDVDLNGTVPATDTLIIKKTKMPKFNSNYLALEW